jgi:hypothetical protein
LFARQNNIPLAGLPGPAANESSPAGDTAVFVVTVVHGQMQSQWLTVLESDGLTAAEQAARPPIGDIVRYTTTGNELRYRILQRTALKARWIGPFARMKRIAVFWCLPSS